MYIYTIFYICMFSHNALCSTSISVAFNNCLYYGNMGIWKIETVTLMNIADKDGICCKLEIAWLSSLGVAI